MPWWDDNLKQKAIDLAVATTAANAAKETKIPAGTIRRWLSGLGLTNGALKNERSKMSIENKHRQNEHYQNEHTEMSTESERSEPDPPAPFSGQCEATGHKSGERCRWKAMPGERFCRYHLDGRPGQCTAKSKQSGERCKKLAEPGKDKCKFHGGKSIGSPGHQNALKHGFFSKLFPDDGETRAIISEIMEKSPLEILWENIMLQYLQIARAQKIS